MSSAMVLVTGAAGGIGWAVTQLLCERGFHVIACDDFTTGVQRNEQPGITWEHLDVADADLPKRLSAYSIHSVVHCAARLADRSMQEPSADVRTNCFGSMQIFEWCARAKIERVLFLSSSAVYGEQPAEPIRETAPIHPGTIYCVSKLACEGFLKVLEAGYGLRWTVLRLFPTYGGGHKPSKTQGILNVMLTQLLAGNEIIVKGSLGRVRDLVYVEDTARAIVDALFASSTVGGLFNVGTGQGHTVREMIYMLAEALDRRPESLHLREMAGTPGDPQYNVADISKIRAAVDFTAKYTLQKGIERIVAQRLAAG